MTQTQSGWYGSWHVRDHRTWPLNYEGLRDWAKAETEPHGGPFYADQRDLARIVLTLVERIDALERPAKGEPT